jgi:hypothetical protein
VGNTGARALFSRWRLISEASLPVFQRGGDKVLVGGEEQGGRIFPRVIQCRLAPVVASVVLPVAPVVASVVLTFTRNTCFHV